MVNFAKIVNGNIEMFVQPNNILGDCTQYAKNNGYKEVEERFGSEEKFEDIGDKIIITHKTPEQKPILAILQANSFLANKSDLEIKTFDIDLLEGLYKESKYSKGYLYKESYFTDSQKTKLAIKRTYELVYDSNFLIGEKIKTEWYCTNGNVILDKEVFVEFSAKDAAAKKSQIRQIQIDYLQYPERPYQLPQVMAAINKLFEHYKDVVIDYKLSGSDSFKKAVENETDTTIKAILNTKLPDGKSFKESILYQIT